MEYTNYIQTLGTLLTLPHSVHTARAARHLVCREVIKANPIDVTNADAEMFALNGGR